MIGGALVWNIHDKKNEKAQSELQYQKRLNYISCLQEGRDKVEVKNSTTMQIYLEAREFLTNANGQFDKGKAQELLISAKKYNFEMQEVKIECETKFGKFGNAYNTALQQKLDSSFPSLPLRSVAIKFT